MEHGRNSQNTEEAYDIPWDGPPTRTGMALLLLLLLVAVARGQLFANSPVWNILGRRGGDPDGGQLHHDPLPDMMPRRTDDALLYRSMTPQQLGNPYWRVGRWPDLEERRLGRTSGPDIDRRQTY
ncbi:hypothetical protein HPB51_004788 [Rhipicephalus microplus]|uniref:Uncharacterized protein n=1 Tax=Rhipicephalus microplus TaxID=6941 RepID=A0A9J6E5N1_RHIMP|nr:hypothetical protein HPB51_004788 [Rhipicephalus microplus]